MKKMLFALAGFFLTAGALQAQDEGAKLAKNAGKDLTMYIIDPSGNAAKLEDARQKIDQALKQADAQAIASAWITKGDVYKQFIERDIARRMIDPKAIPTGENMPLEAFLAYKKGFALATKKYEKSDAVRGIAALQGELVNAGVRQYEASDFEKAFQAFQAVLQSHELLQAEKQQSLLDDVAQYDDLMYYTGLTAMLAKKTSEAMPYFETLYKKGTDKAAIYEALYNARLEVMDEAGAQQILGEGRQKFPNDSGLLFAEINAYLKAGKLDELTGRLKEAIEKEPGNVGLYVTLGNVYDNLYQAELRAKNDAKATEHFNEAKNYYGQAMARDPKNVDAVYSLGALYYNKAAFRTQEMNALSEDFSSAGLKKLENMRTEVMGLFDEALPYFLKAESIDANDINTLIALSEIYARKEDEVLMEYKRRIEVVVGGSKNPASYNKQ